MNLYQAAFLNFDGTPSGIRLGLPTTENEAAYAALRASNTQHCDTCVVKADTDIVVQTLRYRPDAKPDPLIAWTRPILNRFKREYGKARNANAELFTFDGHEFLTAYAKHLIEYLQPQL